MGLELRLLPPEEHGGFLQTVKKNTLNPNHGNVTSWTQDKFRDIHGFYTKDTNELVGYVGISHDVPPNQGWTYLSNLMSLRKGMGTEMLKTLRDFLKNAIVYFAVHVDNVKIVDFYRRFGDINMSSTTDMFCDQEVYWCTWIAL